MLRLATYCLACLIVAGAVLVRAAEEETGGSGEAAAIKREFVQLRAEMSELEEAMASYEQEVNQSTDGLTKAQRSSRIAELHNLIGEVEALESRRAALARQIEALEARLANLRPDQLGGGELIIRLYDGRGTLVYDVMRGQGVVAKIDITALPTPLQLDRTVWTMDRPAGSPVERAQAGAEGLNWSLQSSAESALGVYTVQAELYTDFGVFQGSTNFNLVDSEENDDEEGDEVRPGDDAIKIEAAVDGPLYTGRRTLVRLSGLPFEVEDVRHLSFSGVGPFTSGDFWVFEPEARRIWFRPKKPGKQSPRFMLSYKGQQVVGQLQCDVELTRLDPEIHLDRTDLEKLTVPYELEIPEYLKSSFQLRPSAARVIRMEGDPRSVSGGAHLLRGELNAEWMLPGRRYRIDIVDATDAEAVAEFDMEVRDFEIKLPRKLPPADEDILLEVPEWRSLARQLSGFDEERVLVTPNVRHEHKGANDNFWLMTEDEDEPDHPVVRIVGIGERGIAKAEKRLDIDCVCQDVPGYVRSALRKASNPWAIVSRVRAAVAREDEAEAERIAREYARDLQRVFEWWAGLDECRHLSRRAKEYFGTMAELFELAQQEEPPEGEAERLVNKLRTPLTQKDIKKGFMGDEFKDLLGKELGN